MNKPVCLNCCNPDRPVNRPRGLCWRCWYTPSVRNRFASRVVYGVGIGYFAGRLPKPTHVPPGTEAKVEVMAERARRGEQLHHPLDGE